MEAHDATQLATELATELVDRYLDRHAATDTDGVVALFDADATLEDPVGTPPHRGAEPIRSFYADTHRRNGRLVLERVGPVVTCGREAATHVRARLAEPAGSPVFDVIYTFQLDAAGRIACLRAFF